MVTMAEGAATVGEMIQRVMDDRRLSLRQVASYIGVAPTTVTFWLRGATTPEPSNIRKLADALRLDFDALMIAAGHLPPPSAGAGTGTGTASVRKLAAEGHGEPISPQDAIIELAAQALKGVTSQGDSVLSHDEILARLEAVGGKRVTRKIRVQQAFAHAGEEGVEGAFTYIPPEPVSETVVAVPINGGCMEPEVRSGDTVYVDVDGSPMDGDLVLAVLDAESRPMVRWYDKGAGLLRSEDGSDPIPFTEQMMVLPILGVHREVARRRW